MTSVFSWQNYVSLWPTSFCTPRPNLPGTPGSSWLSTFVFQAPIRKRTSFLGLVLEGLADLQRTVQLQLLQHYWLKYILATPLSIPVWLSGLKPLYHLLCSWSCILDGNSLLLPSFIPLNIYLFIWLCLVLVAARGIFTEAHGPSSSTHRLSCLGHVLSEFPD